MPETDDPTLDELRDILAVELPMHAAFDGWTTTALDLAAVAKGIDPAVARLAFPGGALDMIDAWFGYIDRVMLADLSPAQLSGMKVRARITALIQARLDLMAAELEALRRALAVLALPQNLARAMRLNWRAADAMWHAAGDHATDLNHYTKRVTLGAVYAATIMALLADASEDHADTRSFLDRRIDGIMEFEKLKARFSRSAPERVSFARFVGRLRYPA